MVATSLAINTLESDSEDQHQQPRGGGGGFCLGGDEEGGVDHQAPPVGDPSVGVCDGPTGPTSKRQQVKREGQASGPAGQRSRACAKGRSGSGF